MRAIFFFIFLTIMSIVPVFADEGEAKDANTRYHDAYVQEVIEGKTAEAAKVYLALMNDGGTPRRIQLEARFRFAVCTVLLGRADEGRAQLDELLRMKDLPEPVRARAEEYRKTLSDVGLGTEVDKKMQALVFDLAKADTYVTPGVYREFEVIGAPAVPFIRKLLQHRDAKIRHHAYRLLLRMKEPGVVDAWETHMSFRAPTGMAPMHWELEHYFAHFEGSRRDFEKRVLSLGKPGVRAIGLAARWSRASPEFLEGFVGAGGAKSIAAQWAVRAETPATDELVAEYANDPDPKVRDQVARSIMSLAAKRPNAADLFPRILDAAIREGGGSSGYTNLHSWVADRTTDVLLQALDRMAEEDASLYDGGSNRHWTSIAAALWKRELTPKQYETYFGVLRRRIEQLQIAVGNDVALRKPFRILRDELRWHLAKAPPAVATGFVTWLFQRDQPYKHGLIWSEMFAPTQQAEGAKELDISLLQAAAKAAPPEQRGVLLHHLPMADQSVDSDVRRQQVEAYLEALPTLPSHHGLSAAVERITTAARVLDDAFHKSVVERLYAIASGIDENSRPHLQEALWLGHGTFHFVRTGIAHGERHWESLPRKLRERVLDRATHTLSKNAIGYESELRGFILRHRKELTPEHLRTVVGAEEGVLPYEAWIPLIPAGWFDYSPSDVSQVIYRIEPKRADEIAKHLVDAGEINDSVIKFATSKTSEEQKQLYADRFLALPGRRARAFTIHQLSGSSGRPASIEAIERTLMKMVAEEDPEWDLARILLKIVLLENPTPALLPTVEKFLASGQRMAVLNGVEAAASLGSEELIPTLKKLLHSMDKNVRRNAKKAIDEIDALIQLRSKK